jgi:hypothetical protein
MQPGASKRQKELARQQRAQEKAAKRQERKKEKMLRSDLPEGAEDPDIAGIVPGPQPPLEDY